MRDEAEDGVDPRGGGASDAALLSNASALLGARVLVAALGWAGTVLIVRALSDEAFGQFSLVFSILGMLSIVTDMGIGRVALAGVGVADPQLAGRFVGNYVVLRALLGVVGYLVALAVVVLLDVPDDVVRATAVAGIVVLVSTPTHALGIVFQVRMQMHRIALATVVAQTAQLACTVAVVAAGGSLLAVIVPAVLFELIMLAILLPQVRRLLPVRYGVDLGSWRRLIREALPLSIGTAFATVYYRVDSVMLSQLDGFEAVATYNVAYKFADIVHFASTAVTMSLLPILVRAWPDDLAAFRRALRTASVLLGLVALLSFVQFLLYAEPVLGLLYGDTYRTGATALVLLVASEALSFSTSLAFVVLTATAHHRVYPWVAAGGLLLNVGLNLALIPSHSYEGAAFATLLTECVVAALLYLRLGRIPHVRPFPIGRLPFAVPAACLAAGIGAVLQSLVPWWVGGFVVLGVYGAVVHLFSVPGPNGLRSLRGGPPSEDEAVPGRS